MGKPMPLPVFDRRSNKLFQEFMKDSTSTYESKPHRSIVQWITSSPTVDWVIAAHQNTKFSARKIEPFVRKHNIDMSEFEPGPRAPMEQFGLGSGKLSTIRVLCSR